MLTKNAVCKLCGYVGPTKTKHPFLKVMYVIFGVISLITGLLGIIAFLFAIQSRDRDMAVFALSLFMIFIIQFCVAGLFRLAMKSNTCGKSVCSYCDKSEQLVPYHTPIGESS